MNIYKKGKFMRKILLGLLTLTLTSCHYVKLNSTVILKGKVLSIEKVAQKIDLSDEMGICLQTVFEGNINRVTCNIMTTGLDGSYEVAFNEQDRLERVGFKRSYSAQIKSAKVFIISDYNTLVNSELSPAEYELYRPTSTGIVSNIKIVNELLYTANARFILNISHN